MMSRREFGRSALVASLSAGFRALSSPASALAAEATPGGRSVLPIVDTHQHLWDLTRFRLPWLAGAGPLNRSFVTRDYVEAARGTGIVKAVYMEVDVAPEQHVAEAEHLIELCRGKEGPTVAAVIGGRPAAEGFRDYIARFKGSPYIKGVRQVLHGGPRGLCLEPRFVAGVRALGEMGMSYDLCMRPGELGDGLKLVEQCPDTRFIVDHCGNADPKAFRPDGPKSHDPEAWRRDMAALAKPRTTICKISGIVASAPKGWTPDDLAPIVNHCLDAFGPDRVVFGGDWPVCTAGATLAQWVEALKAIIRTRPEPEQRKLLHDNAVRFYGLV